MPDTNSRLDVTGVGLPPLAEGVRMVVIPQHRNVKSYAVTLSELVMMSFLNAATAFCVGVGLESLWYAWDAEAAAVLPDALPAALDAAKRANFTMWSFFSMGAVCQLIHWFAALQIYLDSGGRGPLGWFKK